MRAWLLVLILIQDAIAIDVSISGSGVSQNSVISLGLEDSFQMRTVVARGGISSNWILDDFGSNSSRLQLSASAGDLFALLGMTDTSMTGSAMVAPLKVGLRGQSLYTSEY